MQSLKESTGTSIPPIVKGALWLYFNTHREQVILSLWGGMVKVRLGQLRMLFEAIAGPETGGV